MVSIVTKRIKGNDYLYLVTSVRMGEKVRQKTVRYIGRKRPITQEEFDCMEMSSKGYDWVLAGFKDELSYQYHQAMLNVSKQYIEYLRHLDKTSQQAEKERFLSKFIANSNAIEGSTMSVDETFQYLFNDITPKGRTKKEVFMASNMLEAWKFLEKNVNRLPKEQDFFALHRLVNKGIETEETIGKYKNVQNYVGDVYTTSYLFTEARMKKLLGWIKAALKKIDDFEVAFQSHAQFEIIHPFVDGNGRVGRLLMNWILMYRGLAYFAIRSQMRHDYLVALRNAQNGKVEAISKFCCKEYLAHHRFAAD